MGFIKMCIIVALLAFILEVDSTYYFEICDCDIVLEPNNNLGRKNSNKCGCAVQLNQNSVYECENSDNGQTIECKTIPLHRRFCSLGHINFFAISAALHPNQYFLLDGKAANIGAVISMGFDPANVDSPRIEPSPSSEEEIRAFIQWMKSAKLVPDPESRQDYWQAMTKYFSCIHVNECILGDWVYTIEEVLLKVRDVLNKCTTIYNSYLHSRLKQGLLPPEGKEKDITKSLPMLQKLMKRMLDKLIDPCIVHKHAQIINEAYWTNTSCLLSCQFLSYSLKVFGKTVTGCGDLRKGTCKNGVCICSQWIVWKQYQQVSMTSCHNAI